MSQSVICHVEGCYNDGNISVKRGDDDTIHVCNKHVQDFLSRKQSKLKPGFESYKKLPITKDGASVAPGDTVFALHPNSGLIVDGIVWWQPPQVNSLRGSYQVRFRSANQINTVFLPVGACFSTKQILRMTHRKHRKVQKKQERRLRKRAVIADHPSIHHKR